MEKIVYNKGVSAFITCDQSECSVCFAKKSNNCVVFGDLLDRAQLANLSGEWKSSAAMCQAIHRSMFDMIHSDDINIELLADDLKMLSKALRKHFINSKNISANLQYRHIEDVELV